MSSFIPPPGYTRIKLVHSFEELIGTRFGDGVNALCWPRTLPGNFGEIVEQLSVAEGILQLDEARLMSLSLSAEGQVARDIMLADQRLLQEAGLAPVLDCIHGYPRDDEPGAVPVHVYSFHADSAPVDADTYLCSYYGPSSEGLRNEEAIRRVDIPETRAALWAEFGQGEEEEFREYLRDNCYDLHYAAMPQAQPFVFGLGNLWRIAVDYPDSPVPPCVHRAPENIPGGPGRLLLIS